MPALGRKRRRHGKASECRRRPASSGWENFPIKHEKARQGLAACHSMCRSATCCGRKTEVSQRYRGKVIAAPHAGRTEGPESFALAGTSLALLSRGGV